MAVVGVSGHHSASPHGLNPQAALPVSSGTLGVWLFLTTEFMLFAALIGAWLVLRISAGSVWPTAETMHAKWLIGLINTMILLASGVAAWHAVQAAESARSGRSRFWIVATLVLGCVFLAVKFYELREKQALGLLDARMVPAVKGEADSQYVADVAETLRKRGGPQSAPVDPKSPGQAPGDAAPPVATVPSDEDQALIREGLVGWTARQAGRTPNLTERQALFDLLATLIYPRPDPDNEPANLLIALETLVLKEREGKVTGLQTAKAESLKALQAGLAAPQTSGDRSADAAARRSEAATTTQELTALNGELVAIRQRLAALERFAPMIQRGLNAELGLGLPVAIRGGPAWMSTWLLLTGMHAAHILGGLLVWAWLLVAPASAWWRAAVANAARYWHFVDAVWLVIFAVVYF